MTGDNASPIYYRLLNKKATVRFGFTLFRSFNWFEINCVLRMYLVYLFPEILMYFFPSAHFLGTYFPHGILVNCV